MPEPDVTLAAIAAAGLAIAVEDGLDAITHERVAARSGLDRELVRERCPDRRDLVEAAVARVVAEQNARMDRNLAHVVHGDADPARTLARYLRDELTAALEDRDATVARLELYLAGLRRPELSEATRDWRESARSGFGDVADATTAWALHAAGLGAVLEALVGEELPSADDLEQLYRRLLTPSGS